MRFRLVCATLAAAWAILVVPAWGQRVHIPSTTLVPTSAPNTAPAASLPPSLSGTAPASGATLGAPSFDPYAITPIQPAPTFPPVSGYTPPPTYVPPPVTGTMPPQIYTPPGAYAPQPTYPPAYGANPYGQFPASPPVQFPGGQWSEDIGRTDPYQFGEPLRLFQNIRLRHTYISRLGESDGLGINDTELATTIAFPRFLATTQPLYISPGFILHFWDGPEGPPADLPPRAYTGYVDFDYVSNPAYRLGADLHVRLGLYSDFNALDTHSFRVSGRGLGTYRLTPTLQAKFGVEYINRNDLKLLPAGGLLWTPNPQVRFDIYFPRPKLAMYVTTLGTTEVWAYLGGEYGGGAWTIERAEGGNDRVDINDLRIFLGTEWMTGRSLKGFFEGGYVFEREVVYVNDPTDSFSPGSSFMLRGGLAY